MIINNYHIKMEKSIIDIIEKTEKKYGNKEAFIDSNRRVTYKEFTNNSKKIGTYINKKINCINIQIYTKGLIRD